jgi:mannitol/fructose-specific phosphotransferase system IIA component (Ntr-type)
MLHELFSQDRILMDMACLDRYELFEALVASAAGGSADSFPREEALRGLLAREALMPTAIRPGIAIPHAKLAQTIELCGAVAFLPAGLSFSSPEADPVRVVFMLLSSKAEPGLHLEALKRLAQLIDAPGFSESFAQARDAREANALIRRFESQLKPAKGSHT